MASDVGCCKYLMFFFNLLIFLGGVALLAVGIWVAVEADSFREVVSNNPIFHAVYIIIAVGSLLFLVGFLGCCGAIKENKCLLGTFFALVLIIFIVEIVGGILAFVYYPTAEEVAIESMRLYDDPTDLGQSATAAWDAFQEALQCCGINGPLDWTTAGQTIPPCPSVEAALTPCKDALQNYFWVLGGIACGVLVVELLAMIFACCLYQNIGGSRYT